MVGFKYKKEPSYKAWKFVILELVIYRLNWEDEDEYITPPETYAAELPIVLSEITISWYAPNKYITPPETLAEDKDISDPFNMLIDRFEVLIQ